MKKTLPLRAVLVPNTPACSPTPLRRFAGSCCIYNGTGYYVHHFRIDAREPNTNNSLCNEPTLLYADGGTTVYVDLLRNTPGTVSSASIILSGYLENA